MKRREVLQTLGLVGLGATVAACGGPDGEGDGIEVPESCIPSPAQVEGPYFIDTGLERRDIGEGRPGVPLRVRLQIVDADRGCAPVSGVTVEVWHADAGGVYSGFEISQGNLADVAGTTFLRGFQTTDRTGHVEFETVYPGWYPSRTVHIHATVLLGGEQRLITQLYFDQATNDRVLAQPPYDDRGSQQTRNEDDLLSAGARGDLFFEVVDGEDGLVAFHRLGIVRV